MDIGPTYSVHRNLVSNQDIHSEAITYFSNVLNNPNFLLFLFFSKHTFQIDDSCQLKSQRFLPEIGHQ